MGEENVTGDRVGANGRRSLKETVTDLDAVIRFPCSYDFPCFSTVITSMHTWVEAQQLAI